MAKRRLFFLGEMCYNKSVWALARPIFEKERFIMSCTLLERFLRYVTMETTSDPASETVPSTDTQLKLADLLTEELKEMGLEARRDGMGYVYASIPAAKGYEKAPAIGFIAHMDTSDAVSGKDVRPRIVENYDGGELVLNGENGAVLSPEVFPDLKTCVGKTLITTDGTTLLGADDKAGVAEIMDLAQRLTADPSLPHGPVKIAFTPDEEIGRGADHFDVEGFGAEFAYTVDGGAAGGLEYENFNAASAWVEFHGQSIHPGSAKGKMKNAILIAMEFDRMLPAFELPSCTEGYKGFHHLDGIQGGVELTRAEYIIRDHDRELFERKKEDFRDAAAFLNRKYGPGTVTLTLEDSYYNMKKQILPRMEVVDYAVRAMENLGITPEITPIRGGTDGARLSYMGLPCPNLFTGGRNCHGRLEYAVKEEMEQVPALLLEILRLNGEKA